MDQAQSDEVMCGRYSVAEPGKQDLKTRFQLVNWTGELGPRFNIAPTQRAPVILDAAADTLTMARWGLIPHWAKDIAIGNRMINARAETVAEKPAFRRPFRTQRCLVLCDGFYEWQKTGKGKVPHRITLGTGGPFAFAGIWDRWKDPDGRGTITSFAILTTEANRQMQPIHDRMPVILARRDERRWLDPELPERALQALSKPFTGVLRTYAISTLVNSPSHDVPEVIKPVRVTSVHMTS